MTYLSTDSISKNYGIKTLFNNLTFGISKGNKTALVAPNGTGKSTLLKILAGQDVPDSGEVMTRNGIRVGYLEQEPDLDDTLTIREFITSGASDITAVVLAYEDAVTRQAENFNAETQRGYERALAAMDAANGWDYEQRMQTILGKLDIHELDQKIATLSGGERKRVALALVLLGEPDLLILDEPTNHLDLDMIEWLEAWLSKPGITLFMVTHDRYFLDRICDHILEMDEGKLYHHKGNYSYYLEKRTEREEVQRVETAKAGQLFKKELEWMRRGPKARTTKAKSRIDAFYDIKEKASNIKEERDIRLEVQMARMGNQIVEIKNISKSYGDRKILKSLSYSFSKGERIGIIGKNGVGKSTFLKILTGAEQPDSGVVETGQTIVFGHYQQQGLEFNEGQRVIDCIKDVAEVLVMADGTRLTASKFLEHFMFSPEVQYTPIEKLSGGEKRRLALMKTLILNPNFLILDEPTNDLDLFTLNRLEEFLMGFGGCLIIVSHDRFFMDKLVDHFFIFEGNGRVRDFNGSYSEYREELIKLEAEKKAEIKSKPQQSKAEQSSNSTSSNKKLSFKEQKEYEEIESKIAALETKKATLETEMSSGSLNHDELLEKSVVYQKLEKEIEQKTARWLELAERA
jgi:ATP-binding cassette subfamily F protein uup